MRSIYNVGGIRNLELQNNNSEEFENQLGNKIMWGRKIPKSNIKEKFQFKANKSKELAKNSRLVLNKALKTDIFLANNLTAHSISHEYKSIISEDEQPQNNQDKISKKISKKIETSHCLPHLTNLSAGEYHIKLKQKKNRLISKSLKLPQRKQTFNARFYQKNQDEGLENIHERQTILFNPYCFKEKIKDLQSMRTIREKRSCDEKNNLKKRAQQKKRNQHYYLKKIVHIDSEFQGEKQYFNQPIAHKFDGPTVISINPLLKIKRPDFHIDKFLYQTTEKKIPAKKLSNVRQSTEQQTGIQQYSVEGWRNENANNQIFDDSQY